jgi:PAT family beta-lactamase induction signal transducer AmpG
MTKITSFLKNLTNPKYAHMTLLGFSAGIPIYLIFSSLSLWLDQVGIAMSSITLFSWAALGYSFKFLWSPLVDRLPLFLLTKSFGQRRSWLLLSQFFVIFAIIWMAFTNPSMGEEALIKMAFAAVLLGFSSATQDIVVDAWRIEASNEKDIAILSSLYIVGYRIGMITSSAGALYLAHFFGTSKEQYIYQAWKNSYMIMAFAMLVGVVTTLYLKEPKLNKNDSHHSNLDYFIIILIFIITAVSFISVYSFSGNFKGDIGTYMSSIITNKVLVSFLLSTLQLSLAFIFSIIICIFVYKLPWVNKNMIQQAYISPVMDLFQRHKAHIWLLIGIICMFRISDIVMGVTANLFYQSMGFDLDEIATIVKTFGLIMTLTGGLVGGLLVVKYGVMKIMIIGAVLSSVSNLLFMVMAETGKSLEFLVVLISADNLSAGLAMAAFIGFLSMLVNKSFTDVQYAMFSSVMTLFPKILGGYSGGMVESIGYSNFFVLTALIGVPVVIMLVVADKKEYFNLLSN